MIFYFLLLNLIKNWAKIPFQLLHFDIAKIIISFLLLFLNFLFFVEGWRRIIQKLGDPVSFQNAFWIMSASQTAKYVPGGVWFALSRMHLGKEMKLRAEIVGISVIIETALTFLVGISLFIFSQSVVGFRGLKILYYIIPGFIFFFLVLYPPLLNRLLNFPLKILKRPCVDLKISYLQLFHLSIYFFGLWIAQIIGFYFLINSIYPIHISKLPHIASAYTLSWMSGFIVIFAPGGLGVREGMMSLLLSSFIPTPLAIVISFLSRVWITVFEIIVFFIGLFLKRLSARSRT